MSRLLEAEPVQGIKPLTIFQVDWSRFSWDPLIQERIRRFTLEGQSFKEFFDFADRGKYLLKEMGIAWEHPVFEVATEVKELLSRNRPRELFFEPEDIAQILEGHNRLECEKWSWGFGDEVYWDINIRQEVAETIKEQSARLHLSRLTPDGTPIIHPVGQRPVCSSYYPYVQVFYVADYTEGMLVLEPILHRIEGVHPELIAKEIVEVLGLKPVTFPKELNFRRVDPEGYKISVSIEGENA